MSNSSKGFIETDNTQQPTGSRAPLVLNMHKFGEVTHQVCRIAENRPPMAWYIAFVICLGMM
jgi:hypothetical protein